MALHERGLELGNLRPQSGDLLDQVLGGVRGRLARGVGRTTLSNVRRVRGGIDRGDARGLPALGEGCRVAVTQEAIYLAT